MPETEKQSHRRILSFSARQGRPLKQGKQDVIENFLPNLEIKLPENSQVDLGDIFQNQNNIHLEIGFGSGEHLLSRAQNNPDVNYIGCEVYPHGIAALCKAIEDADKTENSIDNIRIFTDDARLLLEKLDDNSLERIYILFPDPWPKTRHHKRRIINQKVLDVIARVLKQNGQMRFASDHAGYREWLLVHMNQRTDFISQAELPSNWLTPPEGHITTRYQEKAKAGWPAFFSFKKL